MLKKKVMRFYINYEECKFQYKDRRKLSIYCFILTMRNVNFNEVKVHRYLLKVLY